MTRSRLLPLLVALTLPLTACSADGDPETPTVDTEVTDDTAGDDGATPDGADAADDADDAAPAADAGDETAGGAGDDADDEPAYDCREVDGEEVCDTFGEGDEGPGTTD